MQGKNFDLLYESYPLSSLNPLFPNSEDTILLNMEDPCFSSDPMQVLPLGLDEIKGGLCKVIALLP